MLLQAIRSKVFVMNSQFMRSDPAHVIRTKAKETRHNLTSSSFTAASPGALQLPAAVKSA